MKILNRKQFLALPSGVVYAKFKPCIFGSIAIKGESLQNDWYYQDFLEIDANDSVEWGDLLFDGLENGTRIPMDFECEGRDGLYEENEHFAVFEKEDVTALLARLNDHLLDYPTI